MTQAIPVNKDILKWARETSGLSTVDVAKKLNKKPDIIESWEQGILTPTYPQLEKLAYKVYKRPTAVFFFPVVPQESFPKADFRTLPSEVVDSMPSEIIRIYKKAKVYQLNLKELFTPNEEKMPRLLDNFKLTTASNLPNLAKSIRKFLNIDLQTQRSWRNPDEGIEAWRNALIARDIFIFKDAFHNDHYSGLCLYDENYPVIQINNSMSKTRQIFSIFHEVGHLLYKAGGVDALQESFFKHLSSDYYAIEQKCNEFAGEFLLPMSVFQVNTPVFSEANLIEMADTFKVSREVVLRKYLNSNLITAKTYKSYTEKWLKEFLDSRRKKKENKSGGDHYNTKMSYLGMYYINLVFSHYYKGNIDVERLADYLGIKVGNIPAFEGYVLR
ncbi:MAG: ImmA/IrrE family metallo-endopeptidase [Treponema sp.]|nr:ImmA/IrrE family metallo-endopeptidase [Treponema sp.]